tara:strand:+ start:11710 stop:13578 length:1869 start_codon:yes stop_codon:yes gene_type:complete
MAKKNFNTGGTFLSELNDLFKKAQEERLHHEIQWYKNMSFYLGRQWIVWSKQRQALVDLSQDPSWRVHATTNYTINFVQSKVALLLKNKPMFNVYSTTDDMSDREGAKIAQQLLDYIWRHEHVSDEIKKMAHHGAIYGSGFLKAFWNMDKGPVMEDPNTEEIISLGDVDVKCISPFEIYVDPAARTPFIRDAKWIIHAYRITMEDFEEKYKLKASPESVEDDGIEKQYSNLVKSSGHLEDNPLGGNNEELDEFVTIKEYYENPTIKHPEGRFIIFTEEHILYTGTLPYGKIPISKFDDLFVPDRFWGLSTVEQIMPLQTEYNRTRSQILENRNLMSNPKWVAPRDAIQDLDTISAEPGEIIYYNAIQGIAPPSPMSMPSPPPYVFAQEERILQDMMAVSGISDVNLRSAPPAGVESGRAMAILAEKDETRMVPTIQSWENCLAFIGRCILELAKNNYIDQRSIRVVGADNTARLLYMKGTDLSAPEDVEVTIGQGLGFSRLARVELLLEMYDRGLLRDPNKLLSLLEFGDDKELYEEENMDRNNAAMENIQMTQGQPVPDPTIIENVNVHLEVHRKFIKSEDFKMVPQQGQQLLLQHYMKTNEIVQQQMAEQAKMMMEQQGR